MLDFPQNSHDIEFWHQFSEDPVVFRAQVIAGIYYEVTVRRPMRRDGANEVGLARLVQSSYGKWRFNPTYIEKNLGPVLTRAMREYHQKVQKEREVAEAAWRVFEEKLRVGPPTPPVGDYFWQELRSCFFLRDSRRFRLWGKGIGYSPEIE